MKQRILWFYIMCCVLATATAHAQTPLQQGNELIRQGLYEQALGVLLPSYASAPSGPMAYAIGRCYDGTMDKPRAVQFYQSALSLRGLTSKQKRSVKKRLATLKKKLRNQPRKSTLSVTSNVVGALVRVDGQEIGRTPLSGVLIPPGHHFIEVTKDGFKNWKKEFTAHEFQTVTLNAILQDKPTDVLIHSIPSGAVALVAGKQCETPCLLSLPSGSYTIILQKRGFITMTRPFEKPTNASGKLMEFKYNLQPEGSQQAAPTGPKGFVTFQTNVLGAQVYVNGIVVAKTPMAAPLSIAAGNHQVMIMANGFQPFIAKISITPGQATTIPVKLRATGTAATMTTTINRSLGFNPSTPHRSTMPPPTDTASPYSTWAWVCIGTGSGLLAGGAGLMVGGLVVKRSFDKATLFKIDNNFYKSGVSRSEAIDMEKKANALMISSYVTYGLGVAALTTGLVLLNMEPESPNMLSSKMTLMPVINPHFAGATAAIQF